MPSSIDKDMHLIIALLRTGMQPDWITKFFMKAGGLPVSITPYRFTSPSGHIMVKRR